MSPTRAKPTNPLPRIRKSISDLWAYPFWLEPSNDLPMGSPMNCQNLKAGRLRIITSKILKWANKIERKPTWKNSSKTAKSAVALADESFPIATFCLPLSLLLHLTLPISLQQSFQLIKYFGIFKMNLKRLIILNVAEEVYIFIAQVIARRLNLIDFCLVSSLYNCLKGLRKKQAAALDE